MGDPQIIQSDWWSLAEAFGVPKLSKTSFCGFSKSDFLVVLQHKGDIARRKTMIFWSLGFVQWWVAPVGGTWCRWRDGPFGGGWTSVCFHFLCQTQHVWGKETTREVICSAGQSWGRPTAATAGGAERFWSWGNVYDTLRLDTSFWVQTIGIYGDIIGIQDDIIILIHWT